MQNFKPLGRKVFYAKIVSAVKFPRNKFLLTMYDKHNEMKLECYSCHCSYNRSIKKISDGFEISSFQRV